MNYDSKSLELLYKALANKKRLHILHLLNKRSYYVKELLNKPQNKIYMKEVFL